MKKIMKLLIGITAMALGFAAVVCAGNLDSSAPPVNGSNMPTLTNIYNQLTTGTSPPTAGGFQEPVAGPGSTGRTLGEIQSQLPSPDNISGLRREEAPSGKSFWGLNRSDIWGQQFGCRETVAGTGNRNRWCIVANDTVIDLSNGLVWQQHDNRITWPWINAVDYCASNRAGLPGSGWRLPTVQELHSLVMAGGPPTIDPVPFPQTSTAGYWSATLYNDQIAYYVNFAAGTDNTDQKTQRYYVRCVRGGQ